VADDGYLDIVGTALQVDLEYVSSDGRPPPLRRQLGGHDAVLLRTLIEAQLPEDQRDAMEEALSVNLDVIFGQAWRGQKSQIAERMRSTLLDQRPNASITGIAIPDAGRLRARTTENVSEGVLELLSPVRDATQLTFSYVVTGLEIGWTETFLDFSFKITFDGEVGLYLGLPHDPHYPIAVMAEFLVDNEQLHGGGLIGSIVLSGVQLWNNLMDHPLTIVGQEPAELPLTQLGGLRDRLMTLSQAFTHATEFGFNRLSATSSRWFSGIRSSRAPW
jgi:hypothetical protein